MLKIVKKFEKNIIGGDSYVFVLILLRQEAIILLILEFSEKIFRKARLL